MKKEKPLIIVSHDAMTRRSYTLTESSATILEDYARFLSDHSGFKVTPGDVISKLILKLCKDDLFGSWQRASGDVQEAKGNGFKSKMEPSAHV